MLQLVDDGAVHRLGFVKAGFAEFFRMLGYPADHLMNVFRMPHLPPRIDPGEDGRLQIGVFAPNVCHKNLDTQLLAALLVPGTTVHTLELPANPYVQRARSRIVPHGLLPRPEFLSLLSQMNAALYVSLVECYPMTVLEALACGVVCVTSHTSIQFNDDPELFRSLVVTEHDNPMAIARRLADALQRRAELVPRAQAQIHRLNERAEQLWKEFVAE
jgi:glycosyltransferase involved in cell wall biosynthesis